MASKVSTWLLVIMSLAMWYILALLVQVSRVALKDSSTNMRLKTCSCSPIQLEMVSMGILMLALMRHCSMMQLSYRMKTYLSGSLTQASSISSQTRQLLLPLSWRLTLPSSRGLMMHLRMSIHCCSVLIMPVRKSMRSNILRTNLPWQWLQCTSFLQFSSKKKQRQTLEQSRQASWQCFLVYSSNPRQLQNSYFWMMAISSSTASEQSPVLQISSQQARFSFLYLQRHSMQNFITSWLSRRWAGNECSDSLISITLSVSLSLLCTNLESRKGEPRLKVGLPSFGFLRWYFFIFSRPFRQLFSFRNFFRIFRTTTYRQVGSFMLSSRSLTVPTENFSSMKIIVFSGWILSSSSRFHRMSSFPISLSRYLVSSPFRPRLASSRLTLERRLSWVPWWLASSRWWKQCSCMFMEQKCQKLSNSLRAELQVRQKLRYLLRYLDIELASLYLATSRIQSGSSLIISLILMKSSATSRSWNSSLVICLSSQWMQSSSWGWELNRYTSSSMKQKQSLRQASTWFLTKKVKVSRHISQFERLFFMMARLSSKAVPLMQHPDSSLTMQSFSMAQQVSCATSMWLIWASLTSLRRLVRGGTQSWWVEQTQARDLQSLLSLQMLMAFSQNIERVYTSRNIIRLSISYLLLRGMQQSISSQNIYLEGREFTRPCTMKGSRHSRKMNWYSSWYFLFCFMLSSQTSLKSCWLHLISSIYSMMQSQVSLSSPSTNLTSSRLSILCARSTLSLSMSSIRLERQILPTSQKILRVFSLLLTGSRKTSIRLAWISIHILSAFSSWLSKLIRSLMYSFHLQMRHLQMEFLQMKKSSFWRGLKAQLMMVLLNNFIYLLLLSRMQR